MSPFKVGDIVTVKSKSIHGWSQLIGTTGTITAVQKAHDGTDLFRVEVEPRLLDLTKSPSEFMGWFYEENLNCV